MPRFEVLPRPARFRRALPVAAFLVLAPLCAAVAPRAFCGDAPAAAPSPRLAAVEQEIRHLERRLASLRKVRVELNAGRPEPVAGDDAAKRIETADQRTLRELARYESARSKAVAHAAEAVTGGDDAKIREARAALDAVDAQFLAAIQKVDDARDAASTDQTKDPKDPKDPKAPAPAKPAKKASAGKSAKDGGSKGGMEDMGDDDDDGDGEE